MLSIDEKNKENYEKIRVNAKFEKIMRNLDLLKSIREKIQKFESKNSNFWCQNQYRPKC